MAANFNGELSFGVVSSVLENGNCKVNLKMICHTTPKPKNGLR